MLNPRKKKSDTSNVKIKRLATQVFVGAYQGVTAAHEIERLITDEEWDAQSVICTNMAIATKDIAACTKIRELGNPSALEAAASGAILGGLLGSMSQLMIGASKRPSVLAIANDPSLYEEEKASFASKRPSIVAKVAEHNVGQMDKGRLEKVAGALVPGSSAIVCVFDEVLVKQSDYDVHMREHNKEMSDLTEHVVTKISEQLREGNDVAFHVVVDEDTGEISWTRTVVGDDAIQVRDIVMGHDNDTMAFEQVTTSNHPEGSGNGEQIVTETVIRTPESIATARTLLRNSICQYEVTHEDLIDECDKCGGKKVGDQSYETGIVRENPDGSRAVLYEKSTVQGNERTYESKYKITTAENNKNSANRITAANAATKNSGASNEINKLSKIGSHDDDEVPFDEMDDDERNEKHVLRS